MGRAELNRTAQVWDAIIIGGGPGGCAAATFLARAGHRVLVLEKDVFPRFHIGESLLPYNRTIFAEMGVLPKLEAAGLIRKQGAQFHMGDASKALQLIFRNGRFSRDTETFQVERASFDQLLLQHARDSGADVREGWTVRRCDPRGDTIQVAAHDPAGAVHSFRASFVVDASGRGNLTGNQEGLREIYPRHRKVAIFGHFEKVRLDEDERGGDTVIVRLQNKWFWIIPLTAQKTSVGCVLERDEFARSESSPAALFERIWQTSPVLDARLREAKLLGEIQVTTDFSYCNRRLIGPRLLRVGDAAGFMDPIFSAGVYLAMYSGRLAARMIQESIAAGDDGAARLAQYERKILRGMRLYWKMVELFYTRPFMELLMEPRDRFDLPAAVTALLAGELDGGWRIWWRMRIFFIFVRLQRLWPLVPRLEYWTADASKPAAVPSRVRGVETENAA